MYPRFQESNNPKNIKAYVLHILFKKKHIYPLQNQRIRQKNATKTRSEVPSVIVEPGDVIYVPENWWRSFWSAGAV